MFGMTIGQVFELFDGMTAYLTMIHGGGDDAQSGSGSPTSARTSELRTNVNAGSRGGGDVAQAHGIRPRNVKRDSLPPHIRAMLGQHSQN